MLEENLRRALLLSRGDVMVFMTRPISGVCMVIAFIMIATVAYRRLRPKPQLQPASASV